jgi:hypothetical protein
MTGDGKKRINQLLGFRSMHCYSRDSGVSGKAFVAWFGWHLSLLATHCDSLTEK